MPKESRKPPFITKDSSSTTTSSSTSFTPTSPFLWIIPAIAFGLFISKLFPSPSAGCNFGPEYNSTQLYKIQKSSEGDSIYKIAVVTDLDQQSKLETKKNTWISYFKTGDLKISKDLSKATIHWQSDKETIVLSSQISAGGRGMELSDLAVFDGNLISCDDRIGLVYKIENGFKDVIPWIFLTDGPGNVTKGLKAEWMTIKDNHLWVGGLGKEWTTTDGVFVNYHPMYVKRIGHNGDIQHIDWIENFKKIRKAIGIEWPGYMIHEAVQWSEIHKKWFFMPRRASHEPYTEATDEFAGTDLLLIADENFNHIEVKHIGSKGTGYRGFAAFSFVPESSDNLIAAIKSEEKDGNPVASYLTVFRLSDGHVLLDEEPLKGAHKFEGIAFI
jgi:soluble calcium-activated nucleotidase 1